MIQASELRIGNWISGQNDPYMRVVEISKGIIQLRFNGVDEDYGDWSYDEEDLKPIPLTTEILEKCGFKPGTVTGFTHDYGKLSIHLFSASYPNGMTYFNSWCIMPKAPKSLHELQNLVYALTQKELEVNL